MGEPILRNSWIILPPLLYFNFKSFKDQNSLSFLSFCRFQCIFHDSGVLFSDVENSNKLIMGDLISRGQPILQNSWIIWFPLCISILKVLRTQILHHSLHLKALCMIHEYFSQTFENFHTLKRGELISWGKPILQVGWIIWFVLLYFNFKSWKDPNSLSFIRFQCILHDSGVLFSDY